MKEIRELAPEEFPPLLREINDPPAKLYLEGEMPAPDRVWLTVVGSRRASAYGREVCEQIVSELAGAPLVIVSGLAIGIDTVAHNAALRVGLPTMAMPGSGLDRDVLHPPSNRRLADKIVDAGGALISEFAPLRPAAVHTFPQRNRLMAGASRGVLIIEADLRSGTLITARLALDYNREVLAVPGPIYSNLSRGTHQLIRDGAALVTSGREVLETLGLSVNPETPAIPASLSNEENKIVALLTDEPRERDELIRMLGESAATVMPRLIALELRGIIKESAGMYRIHNLQKN